MASCEVLEHRLLLTVPEPVAPVSNTTLFPNRAAVDIELVWNTDGSKDEDGNSTLTTADGSSQCSGSLIGDHYVLTAAHCLWDRNDSSPEFPDWVFVHAGRDGELKRPYGEARATAWRVPSGWTANDSDSWKYDLAMLSLDRNLGDFTGTFNYRAMPDYESIVTDYVPQPIQAGQIALSIPFEVPFRPFVEMHHYPAKHGIQYTGDDQFKSDGTISSVSPDVFEYQLNDLWTAKGSSGAGLVVNRPVNGEMWNQTIVGIVSQGDDIPPGFKGTDTATRLDSFWMDYISTFKSDHDSDTIIDRPALVDHDAWFGTNVSVINTPTAGVGQVVRVNARVFNGGTATASNVTVRFRLSDNKIYDTTDRLLGTVTIPSIPAFESRDAVLNFTLPALATQNWTVVWSIDPDNTINEFDSPYNDIRLNADHRLHSSNFGAQEIRIINTPPVFTSPTTATRRMAVFEGEEVRFDFDALDPEGQSVVYSLSTQFLEASINSSSGVFTWVPPADFGESTLYFSVIADDGIFRKTSEIRVDVRSSKPSLQQLTADRTSIFDNASQLITVTAAGIDSGLPGQELSRVEFFFDRNNDGLIDSNDDSLGWDTNGRDGWSWTGAIGGLTAGNQARILANAVRLSSQNVHRSDSRSVILDVVAAPPVQQVAFANRTDQSLVESDKFGALIYALSDGTFLAVYSLSFETPIVIQRRAADGTALGNAVSLSGLSGRDGTGMQVVVRPDGKVAVIWNNTTTGLHLTRYEPDGTPIGSAIRLSDSYLLQYAAVNSDGDFIVARVESFTQISGQLFTWDGTALSAQFSLVNDESLLTTDLSELSMLSDGTIVASWRQWDNTGGATQWSNRIRLFDSQGQALTESFVINAAGTAIESAHLAAEASSGIVAVYRDDTDAAFRFFAKRFNLAGELIGSAFPLNTILLNHDGYSVALNQNGWFAVAWDVEGADPGDGGRDEGVYVQIVDADNQLQGPEFRVPVATAGDQNNASIAMSINGDIAIIWDDRPVDFGQTNLFVRTFAVNLPPEILPVPPQTLTPGETLTLAIQASDPDNDTIVWSLGGTPPDGASINSATGEVSWTPTAGQAGQIYELEVQAVDNGTPVRSATRIVPVTVTQPDILLMSATATGAMELEVLYRIVHGSVSPFDLSFTVSTDGQLDAEDSLLSSIRVQDAQLLTPGEHLLRISIGAEAGNAKLPGAGADSIDVDYRVFVVADSSNEITEADANPITEDNITTLNGVYHPVGGDVFILGTDQRDQLHVSVGSVRIDFNGTVYTYPESDVTGIQARLSGENDEVLTAVGVNSSMMVWGGDGDDTMQGGDANDRLIGGSGSNSILSSEGTDATDASAGDRFVAPTVVPIGTTTDLTPTLQWNSVTDAATYELRIRDASNADVYDASDITETTWTSSTPLAGGTYNVQIRAWNGLLQATSWSTAVEFTVDDPQPSTPQMTRPTGTFPNALPIFEWTESSGAVSYELRIRRNDGTLPEQRFTSLIETTYVTTTPLPSGIYSVDVRAVNSEGEVSEWSASNTISVSISIPSAPVLIPLTSASVDTSPTLRWLVPDSAWQFDIEVQREVSNELPATVVSEFGVRDTSDSDLFTWAPDIVLGDGRYIYRVRASNSDGIAGPWSLDGTFEVVLPAVPPAVPIINAVPPADSSRSLPFEWSVSTLATHYELIIRQTASVSTEPILTLTPVSSNQIEATETLPSGSFTVQVRAVNDVGASLWSEPVEFLLNTGTNSSLAGDIDGDADFDASDSFLSHLVKLSGTDDQINLSKGSSALSAAEIRAIISRMESGTGDVDGDSDFDANDTFLIHLVKLSGTDEQITLQKGSSPLSASEIRANVARLGVAGGTTSDTSRPKVTVLAFRIGPVATLNEQEQLVSATTLSHTTETSDSWWTSVARTKSGAKFDGETNAVGTVAQAEFPGQSVDEVFTSGASQNDFRAWLDLL